MDTASLLVALPLSHMVPLECKVNTTREDPPVPPKSLTILCVSCLSCELYACARGIATKRCAGKKLIRSEELGFVQGVVFVPILAVICSEIAVLCVGNLR